MQGGVLLGMAVVGMIEEEEVAMTGIGGDMEDGKRGMLELSSVRGVRCRWCGCQVSSLPLVGVNQCGLESKRV